MSHSGIMFQCSSASRKFLNHTGLRCSPVPSGFQCSSASRKFLNSASASGRESTSASVSVLFSEPKIPQYAHADADPRAVADRFSALQRAENSSIK